MANSLLSSTLSTTLSAAPPSSAAVKGHLSSSSLCTHLPFSSPSAISLRRKVAGLRKASHSPSSCSADGTPRKGIWSIRDDLAGSYSSYLTSDSEIRLGRQPAGAPERFQSVISQLFQFRIIRCGGEVNDEMAALIVGQLLYLDAIDPKKDIVMYINSPGGSVTAGMAIFDTMNHIRPDVSTVCVGLAASMGAFLLGAGAKGKRYSLPSSRIMIHQPLGGAQGQLTDINVQVNEMMHHKSNLTAYISHHTGKTFQQVLEDTHRDYFMSPFEAKEYGLIDGIIMNPKKSLFALPATE